MATMADPMVIVEENEFGDDTTDGNAAEPRGRGSQAPYHRVTYSKRRTVRHSSRYHPTRTPTPLDNASDWKDRSDKRQREAEMALTSSTDKSTENVEGPAYTIVSKRVLFTIKTVIGFMFMVIVLGSAVLSKLTLVSLTDRLRNVTYYPNSTKKSIETEEDQTQAVTIYWYLQLVLLIPNFLTFVRCLAFGVIGKTTRTFPWPKTLSVFIGIGGAVVEVFAMTIFVYLILPELSPGVGILLLCGVFTFQICVDFVRTPNRFWGQNMGLCCRDVERNGYNAVPAQQVRSTKWSFVRYLVCIVQVLLENKITKAIAFLLQVVGIFGFIGIWVLLVRKFDYNMTRPMIGYPLVVFALSVIWSNFYQEKIAAVPLTTSSIEGVTARFKSSFINSGVRLLLYPFVSYIIFRYASPISLDPWCIHSSCRITLNSVELPAVIVQIVVTFVGYIIGWVACTMTLSRLSLALPLLLSTPITVIWYYVSTYGFKIENKVFPRFTIEEEKPFGNVDKWTPIVISLLWISELIAMGYFLLVKTNIILSKDSEMFLTPHYDGVFFEQHMILNRQTRKSDIYEELDTEHGRGEAIQRTPRTIFICSTMYRENETEMKQMLSSIYQLGKQFLEDKKTASQGDIIDKYESHIFFDGAINGTQIQEFGLQLLSLLPETLHVDMRRCMRVKTPYGYRLMWEIGGMDGMPFTVHFKDKLLVKPKKRWSQVMYMNYVLNYRIKEDGLDANDTFILTTDADIDFTPLSADVLLDMLASNYNVGAVCARTHPKGSGPVYWYQIFDYAIGHWFQKPAEHILGCVLCSPGCFSVFRCTALKDVLDIYSSEAIGANEFLMKDMGEDRWLCTLLIKAGWRLEYCAISEDQTYCPTDFGEFFKQRRRWIPSTIANLAQLISEAGNITRRNDSVSILFILFQAIMVFSTAISPATVILVIASGLQSAFKLSPSVTLLIISLLIIVSVFYGLVCIYGSPQTQLDMAKVLTFVFAVIMAIVFVGIFKDTIYNIVGTKDPAVLTPPNCGNKTDQTTNVTSSNTDYEDCVKAAEYIKELAKSLYRPKVLIPVSTTTIYLGAFAVTFLVAAILHLPEWYCLLHCVWYLLALPSGYLLLLIYSAANLDSQSWGTREGSSGKDKGLLGWIDHFKRWGKMLVAGCLWCCRREMPGKEEKEKEPPKEKDTLPDVKIRAPSPLRSSPSPDEPDSGVEYRTMDGETREWLDGLECGIYVHNFERHGYVDKHFIAAMTPKDFQAIGIDKRGFRLRLQKAAKKLPSLPIHTDVPKDIAEWLERLEIPEYVQLFHREGYRTGEDIENIKDLKEADLKAIGVSKRAHLQRLRVGIDNLVKPTPLELRIRHTETMVDNVPITYLSATNDKEDDFWSNLIHRTLKPISVRFQGQIEDMKTSLRGLRNATLGVVFLINIMWIVLLYTLTFPELEDYGLDSRGFQLLFLLVYGFIIVVQFFTLICHRIVTLVHYLGRIQPDEVIRLQDDEIELVGTLRYTRSRRYTLKA